MLGWFYRIMPREERFFDMFERHALCLIGGSKALREMLDGGPKVKEFCAKIAAHEHEADLITARSLAGDPPQLHHAVRPRRHSRPHHLDGRRHRPDEQDGQGRAAVRGRRSSSRRCARPAISSSRRRAWPAKPCRCLRAMRANAPRLNVLTEEIVRVEEQSDQVCLDGLKALLQGPARNRRHGLHQGRRDLRPSRKGRRLLRGRGQPHQRPRHRTPLDARATHGNRRHRAFAHLSSSSSRWSSTS